MGAEIQGVKIVQSVCARIPTEEGEFQLCAYVNNREPKEHLALIMGEVEAKSNVLVRVHSECFTGDVLGSRRCDCGEQLNESLRQIAKAGEGVLVYLRQEGRGIGLIDKLRAYNLQDQGYDTVDANLALGHQVDERDYIMAALILKRLDIRSVRLLTNNPTKMDHLKRLGVQIVERIPLLPTINAENYRYLETKVRRLNHLLNLNLMQVNLPKRSNGSH